MNKHFIYTVRGSWPFPLDMLRRDGSVACKPSDQTLIDALSREHLESPGQGRDVVEITLVAQAVPHYRRWESFGWTVISSDDDVYFEWEKRQAAEDALRKSALSKLTPAERDALGFPDKLAA